FVRAFCLRVQLLASYYSHCCTYSGKPTICPHIPSTSLFRSHSVVPSGRITSIPTNRDPEVSTPRSRHTWPTWPPERDTQSSSAGPEMVPAVLLSPEEIVWHLTCVWKLWTPYSSYQVLFPSTT